jgi:hypothetical protein
LVQKAEQEGRRKTAFFIAMTYPEKVDTSCDDEKL